MNKILKLLTKKRILFPVIFVFELIGIIIIAVIFNFETNNSLYGSIGVTILFSTIIAFLFKIIHDYKIKHPIIKCLYILIFMLISMLLIMWVGIVPTEMGW